MSEPNIIGELRALRIELATYERGGREDRAEQVRREIGGRLAVVRADLGKYEGRVENLAVTGDHVVAAEALTAAQLLRDGLLDVFPEATLDDLVDAPAVDDPPADEPPADDPPADDPPVDDPPGVETAADSTPRQRAATRTRK